MTSKYAEMYLYGTHKDYKKRSATVLFKEEYNSDLSLVFSEIRDLQNKISSNEASKNELEVTYEKKLKKLRRVYSHYPFRSGCRLNTTKEKLIDLLHRFKAIILETDNDEAEIDRVIELVVSKCSIGESDVQ